MRQAEFYVLAESIFSTTKSFIVGLKNVYHPPMIYDRCGLLLSMNPEAETASLLRYITVTLRNGRWVREEW